jgi:cellulose synthase/poly-beta-1,6-N-acetylglucosamine synthase-like glycosyltransferase
VVLNLLSACWQALLALAGWRSRVLRPDPGAVPDDELPRYTVLVPLYKEHRVAASLVACLSRLSYPADRLQILLLVERDDDLTLGALAPLPLDARFETLVFDPSLPRTKPKACNIGLRQATGELCVIYDAEDRPAPDQLRKAAAAFRHLPPEVVCVQAELHFWNPSTNWLTECFTAEYARRYRLELHGMDRLGLPIPLGGSSNHFRTAALCDLGAWDPHNVTEDADLGIRLARRGWKTRIMDSVTEEEANSDLGNWMRQRSRWIKGHLQTCLVHNRDPVRTWRDLGTRGFIAFQLTFGASQLVLLANPLLWAVTAVLIVAAPHQRWELFPSAMRTVALGCLAAGYVASAGSLAAACAARGVHRLIPTVLTVPGYWVLMSVAAMKALFQLLHPRRRHYWELTRHGLIPAAVSAPDLEPAPSASWASTTP